MRIWSSISVCQSQLPCAIEILDILLNLNLISNHSEIVLEFGMVLTTSLHVDGVYISSYKSYH